MLRYEILDVFTGRAYSGNPLAVVFGADDLTANQMQLIAKEFNLSETSFVMEPSIEGATYQARIFTPAEELPYAGHPSIGTAVALARQGRIPQGEVVQECRAGLLILNVDEEFATLTGAEPTLGGEADAGPLLAATGLTEADLAGTPRYAGTGLEYPYLPVRPESVARARSHPRPDVPEVYLFAWDGERRHAHSRMFAPGLGVPEDPATGSAALGLGVYLVAAGLLPGDGETGYLIEQGAEMGRPSQLECAVTAEAGAATAVRVRGQALRVASGELLRLP
ncbi:trans-2,3-dihydro-3-hydroxyanthranilate isomerase [Stackebrandtia albiflava]|uniref:Trans-2,3-dihydro-3-hydroxyanthranilate isomerase n=1 Tax=Stackebrandtia albiflava TaxID=406432 RepID=A0A562UPI1_9ACTN|nr:PhzF family phenazine biosynthesis protein [Stackebrandtia albiflava]TWJ07521.1 trans-2,3-dihydro-3-hydroxyanthranilate isomerase [Stackebrandtia albiflava]